MNKKILFEVLLCLAISSISMYEGFNLVFRADASVSYYGIGPGLYLLIVSMLLMGGTIVYLVINWRKFHSEEKVVISKQLRMKLIGTTVNCAMYIFLISVFGYLVSTLIFFFLQFKIEGVRPWLRNLILTFIISITYYFVFVEYCSLIFPRGIFFK